MNKQTDAIFAKMVEKYAKAPPENGEITPEIIAEIKAEMNKAKFIADLKNTIEECERKFKYWQIGSEPNKSVNVKVSSVNFDRNDRSPSWVNSGFEEFMKDEPKIYRLQVNLELSNYKFGSPISICSDYFFYVFGEFTKYHPPKLTTFVQLNDKNIFPEEIEINYEFIGNEAYEIMIDLHREEIKKLENEIKKLNQ